MKTLSLILAAALAVTTLTACESKEDKVAEKQADALESQAAKTSNEAVETQLNAKADAIEQKAGNADGGATTATTPDTSPSK